MVHHTMKISSARATPASRKMSHMQTPQGLKDNHFKSWLKLVGACMALLVSGLSVPSHASEARLTAIPFSALPGWVDDDLQGFWAAWRQNCGVMRLRSTPWAQVCKHAENIPANDTLAARLFIESRFTAHELTDGKNVRSGTVTGYYEPLLRGSRTRSGPFQIPIYRTPPDLVPVDLASVHPEVRGLRLRGRIENGRLVPYPTRADIEKKSLLAGYELLWVDDAVDAFFLQVQGSGRVQLPDGQSVRVGYADQNGYPYRSIGRYLIDRGELKSHEASMQGIRGWIAANPHRRDEVLHQNPSVVFFKEIQGLGDGSGPLGSMGLPLTPGRSLAVDPRYVTPGSLVFMTTRVPRPGALSGAIDQGNTLPFQRLMIAQDTGSAIQGAHRSDIFFGTGEAAGEVAGRMRAEGRMFVLLPRQH
jgi:membrane-bound lytic murein transglycosylase A